MKKIPTIKEFVSSKTRDGWSDKTQRDFFHRDSVEKMLVEHADNYLSAHVIFQLQKIAFADDTSVDKKGAAIRFRKIALKLLNEFGIDERKYFCKICSNELTEAEYYCDECKELT